MGKYGTPSSVSLCAIILLVGFLSGCANCPKTSEDLASIERDEIKPQDFLKLSIASKSGWQVPDPDFTEQLTNLIYGLQAQNPAYHKPFVIRVDGVSDDEVIVHGSPAPASYSIRYKIGHRCPLYVIPISDGGSYRIYQFDSHMISYGVIQRPVWNELKAELEEHK